jgi:uncharacterized membrane protein (DUF441 family)
MRVPPYAVSLRVVEAGRTKVRFWLPMFLVWPLLLALGLLPLVAALVADGVRLVSGRRRQYVAFLVGCLGAVAEARGVEVFVEDKDRAVALTVR